MYANVRQYAESLTAAHEAGVKNPKQLIDGLVKLLTKRGDSRLLKKILNALIETEAEKKGIIPVTIETATSPEVSTKAKLITKAETLYPGKKIQATFFVNQELKAGFRIRGKGKELDQSLSTALTELRNHLT